MSLVALCLKYSDEYHLPTELRDNVLHYLNCNCRKHVAAECGFPKYENMQLPECNSVIHICSCPIYTFMGYMENDMDVNSSCIADDHICICSEKYSYNVGICKAKKHDCSCFFMHHTAINPYLINHQRSYDRIKHILINTSQCKSDKHNCMCLYTHALHYGICSNMLYRQSGTIFKIVKQIQHPCCADIHTCTCFYKQDNIKHICLAGKHICTCQNKKINGSCLAMKHECVCWVYEHTKKCISLEHICVCNEGEPYKCMALSHKCMCIRGDCRAEKHKCICDNYSNSDCNSFEHKCICSHKRNTFKKIICKALYHNCVCLNSDKNESNDHCGATCHKCVCRSKTDEICRSDICKCICRYNRDSLFVCDIEPHNCICELGRKYCDVCKAENHSCVCSKKEYSDKCKAENHNCICFWNNNCEALEHRCLCEEYDMRKKERCKHDHRKLKLFELKEKNEIDKYVGHTNYMHEFWHETYCTNLGSFRVCVCEYMMAGQPHWCRVNEHKCMCKYLNSRSASGKDIFCKAKIHYTSLEYYS